MRLEISCILALSLTTPIASAAAEPHVFAFASSQRFWSSRDRSVVNKAPLIPPPRDLIRRRTKHNVESAIAVAAYTDDNAEDADVSMGSFSYLPPKCTSHGQISLFCRHRRLALFECTDALKLADTQLLQVSHCCCY